MRFENNGIHSSLLSVLTLGFFMTTNTTAPYNNIINAIHNNSGLNKDLFNYYVEAVNGESIFELSETELTILEFIRKKKKKVSLNLELSQENPKTGQVIQKFAPSEKFSSDLLSYKHTPYQYVVSIS